MTVLPRVAQRAASLRSKGALIAVMAAILAVGSLTATAPPAEAAGLRVVVVVGPAGAATSSYLAAARGYARQARAYGAIVSEVYTPYATWGAVQSAARGANLFIYLGHGNGWPSPYPPFDPAKQDGLGLDPFAGSGNVATKYFGESYVASGLHLAKNAVVILNHLCYAAGAGEPGMAWPTLAVARQRVDDFAAGFLRAGARAVFADTHGSVATIISSLFRTNRTMAQIFWADPVSTRRAAVSFASSRTPGKTGWLDPRHPGQYFHSVVGDLGMTAGTWR